MRYCGRGAVLFDVGECGTTASFGTIAASLTLYLRYCEVRHVGKTGETWRSPNVICCPFSVPPEGVDPSVTESLINNDFLSGPNRRHDVLCEAVQRAAGALFGAY